MQVAGADADALTTLYAHTNRLIPVSPLDLAVWPGHDGDCRCRVRQSTTLPSLQTGPNVQFARPLMTYGLIPTDAHTRSY